MAERVTTVVIRSKEEWRNSAITLREPVTRYAPSLVISKITEARRI